MVGPTAPPRIALFGAAKSGRSKYFTELAARQPHLTDGIEYRYWDLLGSDAAKTQSSFWRTLGELVAPGEATGVASSADFTALLSMLDAAGPRRLVLVLDDWDQAREHSGSFLDLGALQSLIDFAIGQEQSYGFSTRLGIILVTSFPSRELLIRHAHRVNAPGLLRISGQVQRHFITASVPFLDCADAREVVERAGVTQPVVTQIVEECGGWLGLLEEASAVAIRRQVHTWDDECRRELQEALPRLLGQRLLPVLKADWELASYEETWRTVIQKLHARTMRPEELALPVSCARNAGLLTLPAALANFAAPPAYLLVDTESLRMPYDRHAQEDPTAYPEGLDRFTQREFKRPIAAVAQRHHVKSECVMVIAKSRQRSEQVFGSAAATWQVITPGTDQYGGENDDSTLALLVGQIVGRDPRSNVVVLTGDGKLTLLLKNVDVLHKSVDAKIVCYAPFDISRKLLDEAPAGWKLNSDLFPAYQLPRPPSRGKEKPSNTSRA